MEPLNDEQRKLVEENTRLAAWIVQTKFNFPEGKKDDYVSVAYIGLCKAASTFKPEYGLKFATYASRCIQNEVLMGLRRAKKHANEVKECDTLFTELTDGQQLSIFDILPSEDNTEEEMEYEHKLGMLREAIEKCNLTNRERKTIEEYFLNSKTQRVVAEITENSQSYTSRIKGTALEKLRRYMLAHGYDYPVEQEAPNRQRAAVRQHLTGKEVQVSVRSSLKASKTHRPGGRAMLTDEELAAKGLMRVRNEHGKIWYKKILQDWKEHATDEELKAKGFERRSNGKVYKRINYAARAPRTNPGPRVSDEELFKRGVERKVTETGKIYYSPIPKWRMEGYESPEARRKAKFVERHANDQTHEKKKHTDDYNRGYNSGFQAAIRYIKSLHPEWNEKEVENEETQRA